MGHADRYIRFQARQIGEFVGQVEVEIDARIVTRKAAEVGGEKASHGRVGQAHFHGAVQVGVAARDVPLGLEQFIFDSLCRAKQVFAGLGRDESVARTIEKSGPEAGLQRFQSAIHRCMIETQYACRAAQRTRSVKRQKDAQIVSVDG